MSHCYKSWARAALEGFCLQEHIKVDFYSAFLFGGMCRCSNFAMSLRALNQEHFRFPLQLWGSQGMCRTCLPELLPTAGKAVSPQELFLKWIMQGSPKTGVFGVLSCKNLQQSWSDTVPWESTELRDSPELSWKANTQPVTLVLGAAEMPVQGVLGPLLLQYFAQIKTRQTENV